MATRVFVSYRRDDERAFAARIRDRLASAFGSSQVFMDVDHLIAGQRFDQALENALAQTDVFLAIIGPRWLPILQSRSESEDRDFVREEIARAISGHIPLIPVLIDGATIPSPAALPTEIRDLVMHHSHRVGHEQFGRDMQGLVHAIKLAKPKQLPALPFSVPKVFLATAAFTVAAYFLATTITTSTKNIEVAKEILEHTKALDTLPAGIESKPPQGIALNREHTSETGSPPTPEEYIAHVGQGAQIVPPGQLKLDDTRVICGQNPTVLDDSLDDYSAAYPGFLILNPRRLAGLSKPIKLWTHAVACGYQFRGPDPRAADCFAVQRGRREGWLTSDGMEEVCKFISPSKGNEAQRMRPGHERCEAMRRCYSTTEKR